MQKRFRFKREAHGKKATKGGLDYVEFVRSSKCSAKLFYGWTYPDMTDMKWLVVTQYLLLDIFVQKVFNTSHNLCKKE